MPRRRNSIWRHDPNRTASGKPGTLHPVCGRPKQPLSPNIDTLQELRGESIYAQDLLTLGDRFSLLLGVRHDWIRQTNSNCRNNVTTRQSPSVTSPRAAFTFAPTERFSAYVSYGNSFRFNQGVDASATAFAPERGTAYEGGFKIALLEKRLTGTASVFRITKDNVLVADLANSGFSLAVGRARSEGAEAELNFTADDRLTLTAVYAYTKARIVRDTRPAYVGSGLSNVPRHSAAAFAFWQSDGQRPGSIGLGGGFTYVGG